MPLTEHQRNALLEGLSILKTSNRLLIKGSAGVGKTYLVNEIVKHLRLFGLTYCSAPTHKAVAVLKEKVNYPNVTFLTTHSALKLKKEINFKTGDISFKPGRFSDPLANVRLFIIDEASMISSELLSYIEDYSDNRMKIIFIGDEKQLNPVNELHSPVFHVGYPFIELTEIIRQGEGNPIIDLSRNLPAIQRKQEHRNDTGGYIYTYDLHKIIATLAIANGTDQLKYLAWTNMEVDKVNTLVRQKIYGTPNKIEIGETMVFNAPYEETYFTNEEITVKTLQVETVNFAYMDYKHGGANQSERSKYKYADLKIYRINSPGKYGGVVVIHEDSEKELQKIAKEMKAKCKFADIDWIDYYSFIEQFADLKYNHAITVHKSQGSTYQDVIVNIGNLNYNRNPIEKERLLYTAVTRASNLLILYNV